MGLLKHVILPLYVVTDLMLAYGWLVKGDGEELFENWKRESTASVPVTNLEAHVLDFLGAVFLAMAINSMAAIWGGNSFHRGSAVALHVIVLSIDTWSYVRLGTPVPPPLLVVTGIGIVGMIVHAMEPGIFTTDKKLVDTKQSKTG